MIVVLIKDDRVPIDVGLAAIEKHVGHARVHLGRLET
jgi:hypothetical protein